MANRINSFVKVLKDKQLTLALAESMTCGLAAHKLSNCSGTSDVLTGSVVCYTPEVKKQLLHIPQKIMDEHTCESMPVTESMATNLSTIIKADIHAAITGLASPGGSETKGKPVGTVFFCVRYKNKLYRQRRLFKGTPKEIKDKACRALYAMILRSI